MKQGSVKKRIFISNAFMVLVSLLVFLAINLVIIKGYSEAIEKEIRTSVEQIVDEDGLEDLIIDWTFQRNEFLLYFLSGLYHSCCSNQHLCPISAHNVDIFFSTLLRICRSIFLLHT